MAARQSYVYVGNNPMINIDPFGTYFVYKNTDTKGREYYEFKTQAWLDALAQGATIVSIQRVLGNAIAGSSISDKIKDQIEVLHDAEIAMFQDALSSSSPLGKGAVLLWKAGDKLNTIFRDIPSALSVRRRDIIMSEVLDNAKVAKTSYSKRFIGLLSELDDYIIKNSWIFTKYKSLDNRTPYEIGKAIVTKNTKIIDKAKKSYKSYFGPAIEANVLAEKGFTASYWMSYYQRVGCFPSIEYSRRYPVSMIPPKKYEIAPPVIPIVTTTKTEATNRINAQTSTLFSKLEQIYKIVNGAVKKAFS